MLAYLVWLETAPVSNASLPGSVNREVRQSPRSGESGGGNKSGPGDGGGQGARTANQQRRSGLIVPLLLKNPANKLLQPVACSVGCAGACVSRSTVGVAVSEYALASSNRGQSPAASDSAWPDDFGNQRQSTNFSLTQSMPC